MRVTMDIGSNFPEITGPHADAFAEELLKLEDSDFQEIILDFSHTSTMSSMAMGSLFATYQKLAEQNRKLRIINPSDNVKRLLKLVDMGEIVIENEEGK